MSTCTQNQETQLRQHREGKTITSTSVRFWWDCHIVKIKGTFIVFCKHICNCKQCYNFIDVYTPRHWIRKKTAMKLIPGRDRIPVYRQLTCRRRETYICVRKLGHYLSRKWLSFIRHCDIIWIKDGVLLIEPLEKKFAKLIMKFNNFYT